MAECPHPVGALRLHAVYADRLACCSLCGCTFDLLKLMDQTVLEHLDLYSLVRAFAGQDGGNRTPLAKFLPGGVSTRFLEASPGGLPQLEEEREPERLWGH
jgi:hypothetical protein